MGSRRRSKRRGRRAEKERRRKERAFLLVMSRGYRRLAWIAPMLTRPYRSPGKFYPTELFAEFIYSLVTPRKLAVEAAARPSRERERDREPVRCIDSIRNWYSDSDGSLHEYMQRTYSILHVYILYTGYIYLI